MASTRNNVELSIIVPTLNEEAYISQLLGSLHSQSTNGFEVIVVDGGSQDDTLKVAASLGARVFVLQGSKEFEARNYAVAYSRAPLLMFSCADVIFPPTALNSILRHFQHDADLAALTGPDVPYDGGPALRVIYSIYNTLRFLFSKFPPPLRAFSSSTNFLVVRRQTFEESGGFKVNDVNADGIMGRYLVDRHKTLFDNKVIAYISGRRASNWGMKRFTRHYLYVLENFFPPISGRRWFRNLKSKSGKSHGEIHNETPHSA